MTAVELLYECQARDIRLRVDGERVVYDAPAGCHDSRTAGPAPSAQGRTPRAAGPGQPPSVLIGAPSVDLHTPMENLREPAHVWSDLLHTEFWVCATQQQAEALHTEGKVAYLPGEIGILRILRERWPESFPEKLTVIHQSKQVFGATVTDATLPAEEEAACPSR